MSSRHSSPAHATAPLDHFDYEHLSSLVAEMVVERVADLVASRSEVGPQRHTRSRTKKRRERCRDIQRIITRILKDGLRISKLEDVGSDRQPDPLDLDEDDEAPWQIDWSERADHPSNQGTVERWVDEVMRDKAMIRLHRKGEITDEQFTRDYVQSLLPFTFDTVRKFIKINQDESGRRSRRLKESKERSKRKERRRELALHRQEIARERTWRGKPIPDEFFEPEYHSDSENNPAPDLSDMQQVIPLSRYRTLRNGATYEMLTPGWRSHELTELFHWLTAEYRHSKGNRPQGTRYYYPDTRRFVLEDIPDGVPRCMIRDSVYDDMMDERKRAHVGVSPEGW